MKDLDRMSLDQLRDEESILEDELDRVRAAIQDRTLDRRLGMRDLDWSSGMAVAR